MVIQNAPTIRSALIDAAVYDNKAHYTSKKGVLNSEEIDAIAKQINVGRWNVYGAMYGPKAMRDLQWEVLKSTFMQIPDVSRSPCAGYREQTSSYPLLTTPRPSTNSLSLVWATRSRPSYTCERRPLAEFPILMSSGGSTGHAKEVRCWVSLLSCPPQGSMPRNNMQW